MLRGLRKRFWKRYALGLALLIGFCNVSAAQAPAKPTLTVTPANPTGLSDVTLTTSAFAGSGGATLKQTNVEIAIDQAFTKIHVSRSSTTNAFTADNSFFPYGVTMYARAAHVDSGDQVSAWSDPVPFTLQPNPSLRLVYSENFDGTPDGQLPAGWQEFNMNPDRPNPPATNDGANDFYYPQFKSWAVHPYAELFDLPWYPLWDDKANNPRMVVETDLNLVQGNLAHSDTANFDSGTAYYEAHLLSPVIDLTGVTNVVVSFNSNYVQNQDNIIAVEYATSANASVDIGPTPAHGAYPDTRSEPVGNWFPLLYYMDVADVLRFNDGSIDAESTLLGVADATLFFYEDLVFAINTSSYDEIAQAIKPRIDDHPTDGKRFERVRVAGLDNQSAARVRWMNMGSYSWYYGIDNFQVWGIGGTGVDQWSLY